jgi:TrmH family RNA methyltransferase
MANFGFPHLAVVAPYEEHWREAKSAIGASELLQNAKTPTVLSEAVADCTFVVGTASLNRRKPSHPAVSLPGLPPLVHAELARGGHVAILFGSEKRGLTSDDLARCHLLVEIPTHPGQPSMNLGQAVAVCLYEIASRIYGPPSGAGNIDSPDHTLSPGELGPHLRLPGGDPPPTSRDLDLLADAVEKTMLAANYSPAAMHRANHHDLHLLLRRLALTHRDTRRILGLFRRILWRLQHPAEAAEDRTPLIPH